jgi:hypothetical protein
VDPPSQAPEAVAHVSVRVANVLRPGVPVEFPVVVSRSEKGSPGATLEIVGTLPVMDETGAIVVNGKRYVPAPDNDERTPATTPRPATAAATADPAVYSTFATNLKPSMTLETCDALAALAGLANSMPLVPSQGGASHGFGMPATTAAPMQDSVSRSAANPVPSYSVLSNMNGGSPPLAPQVTYPPASDQY